jgi:hypothetical protein
MMGSVIHEERRELYKEIKKINSIVACLFEIIIYLTQLLLETPVHHSIFHQLTMDRFPDHARSVARFDVGHEKLEV